MPARKIEFVTSTANPLLKEVRKAASRGTLTDSGCAVAETFHLLEEALRSGCRVPTVIVAESARTNVEQRLGPDTRLVIVPDRVLASTAEVESAQGVVALVEPPQWSLERALGQLTLIIDGVQDPGNLGTILRSAEAFGASGVLLVKGTVSLFNGKALRASAGSIFRVPLVYGLDEAYVLSAISGHRSDLYAAVPHSRHSMDLSVADLTRACAFVIGSEGRGVSPGFLQAARHLAIPTTAVESLNAAIAASILLYEAMRQRAQER